MGKTLSESLIFVFTHCGQEPPAAVRPIRTDIGACAGDALIFQ